LSRNARLHRFAGAALLCIGFACAWTLWTNLAGSGDDQIAEQEPLSEAAPWAASSAASTHAKLPPRAVAYAKLADALNRTRHAAASHVMASLFDSHPLGFPPGMFARFAAVEDGVPAPAKVQDSSAVSRSDRAASAAQQPAHRRSTPLDVAHLDVAHLDVAHPGSDFAAAPPEKPSIFQRLFGKRSPPALAYAAPEDDGLGVGQGASGGYDRYTAVYDISARTVYLPDGTRLEAHSGFGPWLDDPRHTEIKMRGATPVALYDLQPRESLFHGVRALRLIPLDESKVFGRTGLLAHTYMLGSNGQSNGCVSFRNYEAFLRAYQSGEIKRLAVVSQLD
jgi:type VI secretion system (T6SS) effector TldE1-like protein